MQFLIDKSIEDYLAFSDERASALLESSPAILSLVKDVDSLIRAVWDGHFEADAIAAFLNMNAYYFFLASVRVAITGHVSATFPLVRSALESACYGFLLSKDEALRTVWTNRDRGEKEKAACRKALTSAVKDTATRLGAIQVEMASYVQDLYEASITFGGHPNPHSVFSHVHVDDHDANSLCKVGFTCMYSETSFEVQRALLACAEYGIVVAYINAHSISPDPNAPSLNARFNEVNDKKNAVAESMGEPPG